MDDLVYLAALVLLLVALVVGLLRLAAWSRRRGVGHVLMGPFDEIWHPSGGHAHVEAHEQQERVTPAPSPGDRPVPGRNR